MKTSCTSGFFSSVRLVPWPRNIENKWKLQLVLSSFCKDNVTLKIIFRWD
jgi:hypothetical protein